jgi:peroxiredoxin
MTVPAAERSGAARPDAMALRAAQVAFALVSVGVVWAFVYAARDGEQRRAPAETVRLLAPSYTGENRMAPDFDVVDAHGAHHRLGDYRGRTLVLHFWSSTCEPCVDELQRSIPAFDEILRGRSDIAMLMVSVDPGWSVVGPLVPAGLEIPIAFDPQRSVVTGRYGTRLFPETWVIDPDGIIRARFDHPLEWSSPLWIDYLASLR